MPGASWSSRRSTASAASSSDCPSASTARRDRAPRPRARSRATSARLTPLPILLWDERLTTAAAERSLLEADVSRRRRAEVIDKVAATLILQSALDRLKLFDRGLTTRRRGEGICNA